MDTSDSSITFNNDGQCVYCNNFYNEILPHWNFGKDGNEELFKVVKKIKKEGVNKDFDCIIGISGGLDSSYLLHVIVKKYGLRPLVFHVDAGWNSQIAVNNIQVMVEKLGLELYTEVR